MRTETIMCLLTADNHTDICLQLLGETPGYGGPGNTHSSRSGYYELNRIMEVARSHLPSNEWLKLRLTANMNIPDSCNAFWDGATINFFQSSDLCRNTGEISGVFDHEWGHGLDHNDVYPEIVQPSGEGIADIYTALRLGDSCIARGFFFQPCDQYGDPCNECTGGKYNIYIHPIVGYWSGS
jgi:hypothetical protein